MRRPTPRGPQATPSRADRLARRPSVALADGMIASQLVVRSSSLVRRQFAGEAVAVFGTGRLRPVISTSFPLRSYLAAIASMSTAEASQMYESDIDDDPVGVLGVLELAVEVVAAGEYSSLVTR